MVAAVSAWEARAACNGAADPDAWFADAGTDRQQEAARICAGCPVRAECLKAGIDGYEDGTWGGLTRPERTRLVTRVRKARAAERAMPEAGGPISIARQLAALRAEHGTIAATAKAAGMTRTTVAFHLDLLDLAPESQALVQSGALGTTAAVEIVRAARREARAAS